MKKLYKDRLLKLANFLDTLPTKKFDFSRVVNNYTEIKSHPCGTVCCAIGWTPNVFPKSWEWRRFEYSDYDCDVSVSLKSRNPFNYESWASSSKEFFGLEYQEVYHLFAPGEPRPWAYRKSLSDNAKPKTVANSIRKFIQWKESQS